MTCSSALASLPKSTYNLGVFFKYIQPCSPILAKSVPVGDNWQHEIKFDGFRVQAHIIGKIVGRTLQPQWRSLHLYAKSRANRDVPRVDHHYGVSLP